MTDPAPTRLLDLPEPPAPADGEVGLDAALAAAQLLLADYHAAGQPNPERREKQRRVVERQQATFSELFADLDPRAAIVAWVNQASEEDRIGFFVEVFFLEPFAPYQLKTWGVDQRKGLQKLAALVGQPEDTFGRISRTVDDAASAHRQRNWVKVGALGVGAAALLGLGGYLAAPLLGTALGTAAGLSGAAATAHGLALLGGGALAAGGAGMAGGMWLVAGIGAAAGAVAGGGGTRIYQLGAARAERELIKLQTTFKLALLEGQADTRKAQEVMIRLNEELETVSARLEEERRLNDDNTQRIRDLEATLTSIEEAIGWMDDQQQKAG